MPLGRFRDVNLRADGGRAGEGLAPTWGRLTEWILCCRPMPFGRPLAHDQLNSDDPSTSSAWVISPLLTVSVSPERFMRLGTQGSLAGLRWRRHTSSPPRYLASHSSPQPESRVRKVRWVYSARATCSGSQAKGRRESDWKLAVSKAILCATVRKGSRDATSGVSEERGGDSRHTFLDANAVRM